MTVKDLIQKFEQLARVDELVKGQDKEDFRNKLESKLARIKNDHMVTKSELEEEKKSLLEEFEKEQQKIISEEMEMRKSLEELIADLLFKRKAQKYKISTIKIEVTRERAELLREFEDAERESMIERASVERSMDRLKEAITGEVCLLEKANKQFFREINVEAGQLAQKHNKTKENPNLDGAAETECFKVNDNSRYIPGHLHTRTKSELYADHAIVKEEAGKFKRTVPESNNNPKKRTWTKKKKVKKCSWKKKD